jgi:hypothetical protein
MTDPALYPEAFEGWRGWIINKHGRLRSIMHDFVWEPGEEVHATCHAGTHSRIPDRACDCGLYATKTLAKLQANGYNIYGAFGKIKLWGRILENEAGYRSEFAYPSVIYLPHTNYRFVEALSIYGVPVMLKNPHTKERTSRKWTLASPNA